MTDWTKLREQLAERCGGYCEACGWTLPYGEWAAHHRLLRSQGGKDELANLVALHHHCHNVAPGSVHQEPAWAYDRGLMLHMGSEPTKAPLCLPDGSWAFLGAAYTHLTPEESPCLSPQP